jgi:hypothetical protein
MANARRYLGPVDDDKAISTKSYTDTILPEINVGDASKVVGVKVDESGFELVDAPSGGGGTGLPVIGPSDGGKILGAKLDRSGTEWVDTPSGGGSGVGDKLYLYNRVSGAF